FFLAAALAAIGLLRRRRALAGGLLFGIAVALKQTAVVLLPAVALLAWSERRLPRPPHSPDNAPSPSPEPPHSPGNAAARRPLRGALLRVLATAAATGLVLALPFLIWSPGAFISDTATYFYGSGVETFPIRGPGLPGLLLAA